MKKNTQILKNYMPFFKIFLLLIIDIMAMVILKICLKNLVIGQKLVKHWKVTKVKDAIFLLTTKYVLLRILKNRVETRNCDKCKDSDPMFFICYAYRHFQENKFYIKDNFLDYIVLH